MGGIDLLRRCKRGHAHVLWPDFGEGRSRFELVADQRQRDALDVCGEDVEYVDRPTNVDELEAIIENNPIFLRKSSHYKESIGYI